MRKGITPIIATSLLILITVVTAAASFFWISSVQTTIENKVGNVISDSVTGCSRINLISMMGDEIVVQNTGCDTINNVTLLIDGVLTNYDLSTPLSPGSSAVISYSALTVNQDHCVKLLLSSGVTSQTCSSASENTVEGGYAGGEEIIFQSYEGDINSSYCLLNNSGNEWFSGVLMGNTGNYLGNYSFTDDALGSDPAGWDVYDVYGVLQVVSEIDSHKNVVEFSNTALGTTQMTKSLIDGIMDTSPFTAELWIYANQTDRRLNFELMQNDGMLAYTVAKLVFDNDGYIKADTEYVTPYSANTWYHIKLNADGTEGLNYDITINDVLYGPYTQLNNLDINYVSFSSAFQSSGTFYIDAIDYSLAEGYYFGRNKNQENTGPCCGDDGISDIFYNGTIGTTDYFCNQGIFINEALDNSQSLCEIFGYEWMFGEDTLGWNPQDFACCGDDNTYLHQELFMNGTHCCQLGVMIEGDCIV
ncbi:Uncharacterised protein [uncultured archaeon]|nr:Uncharacterised protein [uncultured archaeon]